jgi:ABC-type branched-subunit amino acid transport system ATPase component
VTRARRTTTAPPRRAISVRLCLPGRHPSAHSAQDITVDAPLLRLDNGYQHDGTGTPWPATVVVDAGARHGILTTGTSTGSILLRLIAGTITAHHATIHLAGQPITGLHPRHRARLGIAYRSGRSATIGHLTVAQNVSLALLHHSRLARSRGTLAVTDSRTIRVRALLTLTGLTPHADTPARQLSALQLRLLTLATALAGRPRLLLLDEMSAGLDHDQIRHLADVLHRLPAQMALVIGDTNRELVDTVEPAVTGLSWPPAHPGTPGAGAVPPPGPATPARAGHGQQPPLLSLHHITATTGTQAVTGLTLTITDGALHTLLGLPESGTTLLLDIIAGRHTPHPGAVIHLDGIPVTPGRADLAAERGIRLPLPAALTAHHSVGEHLAHAVHHHRPSRAHRWSIPDVLALFPPLHRAGACRPGELSLAEHRMLAIAVALLAHPRLLLLDDPGHRLAAPDRDLLATAVTAIHDAGVTVLVAEPRPTLTLGIATEVSVLRHGVIATATRPITLNDLPVPGPARSMTVRGAR